MNGRIWGSITLYSVRIAYVTNKHSKTPHTSDRAYTSATQCALLEASLARLAGDVACSPVKRAPIAQSRARSSGASLSSTAFADLLAASNAGSDLDLRLLPSAYQ